MKNAVAWLVILGWITLILTLVIITVIQSPLSLVFFIGFLLLFFLGVALFWAMDEVL